MLTLNERMMLREIKKNSTTVVAWYAHANGDGDPMPTVRGPFHRWFKVTGGENYPKDVANGYDDAKFAAAAMNTLIPLLEDHDRMLDGLLGVLRELLAGHGVEDIAACVCWRCALRRTYIDPALGENSTAAAKKKLGLTDT